MDAAAVSLRGKLGESLSSVQKYATQPSSSRTSTTRIKPPAGRYVARNVLKVLVTASRYRTKSTANSSTSSSKAQKP